MSVYITGDKHGDYADIKRFCKEQHTSKQTDTLIVLGDHGTRFCPDSDEQTVNTLNFLDSLPIRFVLIHGNHDRRITYRNRHIVKKYIDYDGIAGTFYIDVRYPSILYAEEWGSYHIAGHPAFIIGGAYSIDKSMRLAKEKTGEFDYPLWFKDEQLTANERSLAKADYSAFVSLHPNNNILLLTHTCPLSFVPVVPFKDSDLTTETFLDEIAAYLSPSSPDRPWSHWYCGHWHVDKTDGDCRFLYHDIILLPQMNKEAPKRDGKAE